MKVGKETICQVQVCEWVKQKTDLPFIHIANERVTSAPSGSLLKKMGVRAGVSDCFIPRANSTHHGLWIELKIPPNKPTDLQKKFLEDMKKEGYGTFVAYSSLEAIQIIKDFYQILS